MSADGSPNLGSTLGVELIGYGLALALYGIATAQAVSYTRQYARAGFPLPPGIFMVIALWLIGSSHVALLSCNMVEYLVLQRGDPVVFLRPPWTIAAIIVISEFNGLLVRLGYAYRIWRFSGRRRLAPCVIATISVFVFAIGLIFAGEEVHLPLWADGRHLQWTLYTAFSCQIVIDGMIAVSMFLLLRQFKTGLKRLDLVITTIITYAVNTGFLTTLGVTFSIIFFLVEPASFVYLGIYFTLPKLYTCSFLGVLNAEQLLIRHTGGDEAGTAVPVLSSAVRIGPSTMLWDEEGSDRPDVVEVC
ncbi:hypothetical protein BD414DRAFT_472942 [Trametes punicea]|nr:hypothetical protein BD414DRAFT_472942 [Trametes punicea]